MFVPDPYFRNQTRLPYCFPLGVNGLKSDDLAAPILQQIFDLYGTAVESVRSMKNMQWQSNYKSPGWFNLRVG